MYSCAKKKLPTPFPLEQSILNIKILACGKMKKQQQFLVLTNCALAVDSKYNLPTPWVILLNIMSVVCFFLS